MITYRQLESWSPPCPICASTRFQPLAGNDRYGMGVRTAGCLQCGLAQSWPRPTPAAMATFYRDHYREYYQATSRPDSVYTARYHKGERLGYTAGIIAANMALAAGMRVLDIGCAEGTLFVKLSEYCAGLTFVGVEPSEGFADYARQTTRCSTYPSLDALFGSGEGSFDLIIVNHVLEHVDNPTDLLGKLMVLLDTGGKIYVDVPDADRYATPDSLHIAHLFHFSPRTLIAALEKAGLWVLRTECHAPPHHPPSVWCLAQSSGFASRTAVACVEGERVAWGRIRRIDRALPLYLLRARLRRNRLTLVLARLVRTMVRHATR